MEAETKIAIEQLPAILTRIAEQMERIGDYVERIADCCVTLDDDETVFNVWKEGESN